MTKVEATKIEAWINSQFLPDFHCQKLVLKTEAVRKNKGHLVTELKTPVNGVTTYLHIFNPHFTQLHFY